MAGEGSVVSKNGSKNPSLQPKPTATSAAKEAATSSIVDQNLEIIRNLLKKLKKVYLEEELEEDFDIRSAEINEAIKAFNAHKKVWEEMKIARSPIEERMLALEEVVKKSLAEPARKAGPLTVSGAAAQKTYASVTAPPMAKTAVRIRVEGAKNMQPTELLTKAKEHIPGAYAVRQLRSNDTEVFVQSASQRDAALNMAQPGSFKILRHDFPVEVSGVPLRTKIESGRNANNFGLMREICAASKARIPGLEINRIRWLHDGKEHMRAKKNGHTRGSVVLSLPTEGLQEQVVRHGVVIDAMLYAAQVWSPRAQPKQCYNCSQWGHTQASCGKAARCGECAGAHQTRDCPRKRVSCCNCGKEHRSWQRAACRTYQVYKGSVVKARNELLERTAEIRRERVSTSVVASTAGLKDDQGFTLVSGKKADAPKRRPGRPRKENLVDVVQTRSTRQDTVEVQQARAESNKNDPFSSIPYFT